MFRATFLQTHFDFGSDQTHVGRILDYLAQGSLDGTSLTFLVTKHCLTVQLRQTGELCLLHVRKDLSLAAIQHMQGHLARGKPAELIHNGPR